jgi:RimJ/RimL family protein N-acetyltransferase
MLPALPTTLASRHVTLVPLTLDHVAALCAAAVSRTTYAVTTVPDGEAEMRAWIADALAEQDAGRAVPFAIVAPGGEVVGTTRFGNLERWRGARHHPARPEGCVDAVEIGWTWLAEKVQRTAINTAAKRLLLGHAFEAWEVHRVTLKTDVRNARSRAAIERLGAKLDGVLRAHLPAADRGIRDSAVYSILAAEWPAVRARLDGFLSARG